VDACRNVLAGNNYVENPSADPSYLYQNNLIALEAEKGINKGEPFLGCYARSWRDGKAHGAGNRWASSTASFHDTRDKPTFGISLNHLVGARQNQRRHGEPNRPRGTQIDDQQNLRRKFYG
jgi:hypothetical protein